MGKSQVYTLFLEFDKAYDVADHHRLPKKIFMYGIIGKTEGLKVFSGSISERRTAKFGVLQGS